MLIGIAQWRLESFRAESIHINDVVVSQYDVDATLKREPEPYHHRH